MHGNGEAHLPGMEADKIAHKVDASCDAKQYAVTPHLFTFGLTFARSSIDVGELALFAKKPGRLRVYESISIPGKSSDEDEDYQDED